MERLGPEPKAKTWKKAKLPSREYRPAAAEVWALPQLRGLAAELPQFSHLEILRGNSIREVLLKAWSLGSLFEKQTLGLYLILEEFHGSLKIPA